MQRSGLFLVAALTLVAADHPDLSGKWTLNTQKSTFSQKNYVPAGMTLEVTRQGDGYHSKLTTMDGNSGGIVTEGDWFLDGKSHPVPGTRWNQMSKWEGNVLVADKNSAEDSYAEHMRLSVSVDGKRVTENLSVKNTNGTNTSTLVWDRI
jgi:hypothetical protein